MRLARFLLLALGAPDSVFGPQALAVAGEAQKLIL